MNSTIQCKYCGKDIEISEAIRHAEEAKIREEAKKEYTEKGLEEVSKLKNELAEQKKKEEELQKKEQEFLAEKKKLDEKEKDLDVQITKRLDEERKKNNEALIALEKQKKEDEEKIKDETLKEAAEKSRLEKLEFEKKINDMQKSLEEAQRKGKQGSQQLQGEVLELDLEEKLKSNFPQDEFLPVPKGAEGADIWQRVLDKNGNTIGSILWEIKRTKSWSPSWLPKLREDGRRVGATECIIVSEVLPSDIKYYHRKDNVWISNYEFAIHTARTIRFLILSVVNAKSGAEHNDDELKKIKDYILSDAFRHKIEAHQEAVKNIRDSLSAEKRATELRWRKTETQIDRLDRNSSQMFGDLQGVVPELEDVETISLNSGAESDLLDTE